MYLARVSRHFANAFTTAWYNLWQAACNYWPPGGHLFFHHHLSFLVSLFFSFPPEQTACSASLIPCISNFLCQFSSFETLLFFFSLSRFYRYFFPYYRGYNRAELFFFYLRTQFPLERNVFMEILREGNRLINRCKINGYNFVRLVDLVISGN